MGSNTPQPFPLDRQVKRMAYTGNAAIFPRNKFDIVGTPRHNQLVNPALVDGSKRGASKIILSTEFVYYNNWSSIANDQSIIKSHRSIMPFVGGSAGSDVYNEPLGGAGDRFFYPALSMIKKAEQIGPMMIVDPDTTLNAVGRHHPGGDRTYGGTAQFSFCDGHVEQMTVIDSIKKQLWGDRVYSLSGNNRVAP
jgi:prepilin-type processing-associated H-X9-DG protein